MESHLSSDAWPVPWLAALAAVPRVCCVRGCHVLSLALCAAPWCLGCPACWRPGCCAVWVGCVPGVLASWPALCGWAAYAPVHGPALWAVWLGLIFRPCIVASLEGLLKKAFIFALYFSGIFSLVFCPCMRGFIFFLAYFSGFAKSNFFLRIFLRRNSRIFFRVLFSGIFPGLIFAAVSGFLFFLDVIFIRFPVLCDEFFHVVKFQELVHGGLVDSVALAF